MSPAPPGPGGDPRRPWWPPDGAWPDVAGTAARWVRDVQAAQSPPSHPQWEPIPCHTPPITCPDHLILSRVWELAQRWAKAEGYPRIAGMELIETIITGGQT